MTKGIEWLKKEIEKIDVETSENFPHYEVISKNIVLYLINQLDEAETLPLEWTDDNSFEVDSWNKVVNVNLQNLLVPKQEENHLREQIDKLADFIMNEVEGEPSKNEGAVDTAIRIIREKTIQKPVIPQFVADWIEREKHKNSKLYSTISTSLNYSIHLDNWEKWARKNRNFSEIIARAWLDGWTVEEKK